MRVLGLDLGARRIGVAVSDSDGSLATPRCTIVRSGDPQADRQKVADLVDETRARRVVVGLPISLDGRRGTAARAAEQEATELRDLLESRGVEVETFDERLSTVTAERRLADAGHGSIARRKVVDAAAATVILQAWLDSHQQTRDG